ncbi:endolytic transglycosylase MltG [Streptomyces coeruleorubidus]|uniref:Endolytic murein transglycosylase n=1 Tax=Streptomyces coeruleorubidus TaxID=116188 RepID=A0A5J6HUY0_STRC4|nr:endolytic transglycosylase MltG [Streptomyces coeruleorubidus]QEV24179.1 endolytic transglycosylase MltG [Streptomyces coeruleorubidus]GGU08902.1 membrane protein [Streptomyces coeruleorubidus]
MTEYGRGQGSEPWHPEDPLYGDGGWGGEQAHQGQQSPYGGQPQHYPEQPQQPQYGDWGTGEQAGYGQAQQQYPYDQQQYAAQAHGHQQQYPGQGNQGHQQDQGYQDQGYQQDQGYHQQQYDNGGWATGPHQQVSYPGDPADPYGQQTGAYGQGQSDYYGTPEAYPPPEPPGRRRAEPEPEPEPETDWDPGPDQGEHAFFAGGDDDDDGDEPGDRRRRDDQRGRGGKPKKRRNGTACLVVVLVLGGGLAGVSYFGYQFFQDRFGDAPDYAGDGNGQEVSVEIPEGALGYKIGQVLKDAGVVKSVDAFVAAQEGNPQGKTIQDGVYTLQKQMSADSAVELMLSPESRDNLIIAEGKRNADIYRLIDKRLEVKDGTTAAVAKKDWKKLGLPDWALGHENVKDPLEGFLYPSSYGIAKGEKPEGVLKDMVTRATQTYEKLGVEKKAQSLGLEDPWQLITVASLAQAEGTSHDDFRKMAEVVYNRMKPGNPQTNGMLEFDSTYNYIKNQSKIDLSLSELRNYDNPYNTYFHKGLPPGPIDNPGEEALKGALNPTKDGWYYFISLDGKTSEFTKTNAEHQKLVDKFNASRNN